MRKAYRAGYTVPVEFEWDPEKAFANQEKHGVTFAEAATVFTSDPLARTVDDPRHSIGEFRFLTTGYSVGNRLLIIAHTDRGNRMRIITARLARPKERRFYEQET
jgi:uncharacterized DUF497 family protein